MKKYTKLTCHMCSVKTGYGRKIKVLGLYSICDWCFYNIIPQFQKKFEDEMDFKKGQNE